jgi:hypothetical protein
MQSKWDSWRESVTNTAIGYVVAVCSQVVIFPFFGIHIPLMDNFIMALWFTLVSIIRGYFVRRWFAVRTDDNESNSSGE